jgi:hypothetical protein
LFSLIITHKDKMKFLSGLLKNKDLTGRRMSSENNKRKVMWEETAIERKRSKAPRVIIENKRSDKNTPSNPQPVVPQAYQSQDRGAIVRARESIENRRLCCYNLSVDLPENIIRKAFADALCNSGLAYFEPRSISHCRRVDQHEVHLEFINAELATRALNLNGYIYNGVGIFIGRPRNYSGPPEPATTTAWQDFLKCPRKEKLAHHAKIEKKSRELTLVNVPKEARNADLKDFLNQYMCQVGSTMMPGNPITFCKIKSVLGIAFLTFRTEEETQAAFNMNKMFGSTPFMGQHLLLSMSAHTSNGTGNVETATTTTMNTTVEGKMGKAEESNACLTQQLNLSTERRAFIQAELDHTKQERKVMHDELQEALADKAKLNGRIEEMTETLLHERRLLKEATDFRAGAENKVVSDLKEENVYTKQQLEAMREKWIKSASDLEETTAMLMEADERSRFRIKIELEQLLEGSGPPKKTLLKTAYFKAEKLNATNVKAYEFDVTIPKKKKLPKTAYFKKAEELGPTSVNADEFDVTTPITYWDV